MGAPIEPQDFLSGPKIVDIGDIRVARGLTRRPVSSCKHRQLVYDTKERRVWCQDCETDVEPFDAFTSLVEHFHRAAEKADRILKEAHEASRFALISRAAKAIDKLWRRQKMVPACPHCGAGIWPEDALSMESINKEWDKASRERRAKGRTK